MDNTIRVVIADDHKVFLEGLCSLVKDEEDIEVIGKAANGVELLELVEELRPDVVISDISMPDMNGITAAQKITQEFPDTRIIALSMHKDTQFVREILKTNAYGFLLKDCCFDELAHAVRSAMNGEICLSQPLRDSVVLDYIGTLRNPQDEEVALSARESEVLKLIAEGLSTKEVAEQLCISVKTVETHRRQIMQKTKYTSVAELTKYAIRCGLTTV
ncbi:response regulator [Halodesulfovibrio spirochaetisodalis]|uniref:LuxR family transcriptional regulator n=1 Tax=Halodesulfovibrio spirochaetisodalis TaxID=1560234 RepID=A0A1B7XDG1_9BACT|nr:response regulator transcription factor [Halodesulfovibrio spirochaetisodalis]OBQ52097.1 LuxR family transcriptional regulator [Halodesulfovibrio spirochaetisodalis]